MNRRKQGMLATTTPSARTDTFVDSAFYADVFANSILAYCDDVIILQDLVQCGILP